MKTVLFLVFASIILPLLYLIAATVQRRLKLRYYARLLEPIFEHSGTPEDDKVISRCATHLKWLLESGNKIAVKLEQERPKMRVETAVPGQYRDVHIDFINPIIYRDGYPNENWEQYLQRCEIEEKLITEAFHKWLRSIGEKVENNEWYVEKVLHQRGAENVRNFITFQK